MEGHYNNLKTFSLMTKSDIDATVSLLRNKADAYQYQLTHHYKVTREGAVLKVGDEHSLVKE